MEQDEAFPLLRQHGRQGQGWVDHPVLLHQPAGAEEHRLALRDLPAPPQLLTALPTGEERGGIDEVHEGRHRRRLFRNEVEGKVAQAGIHRHNAIGLPQSPEFGSHQIRLAPGGLSGVALGDGLVERIAVKSQHQRYAVGVSDSAQARHRIHILGIQHLPGDTFRALRRHSPAIAGQLPLGEARQNLRPRPRRIHHAPSTPHPVESPRRPYDAEITNGRRHMSAQVEYVRIVPNRTQAAGKHIQVGGGASHLAHIAHGGEENPHRTPPAAGPPPARETRPRRRNMSSTNPEMASTR
ncbi:MAG: hypothetical protein BWY79_00711 [Actinobacteria bacterium ADurb.Bin444]|nr:MAG: hypothetical protein BWY79_00711 [Actinobacteria bacterium ADurb.Bin444]